MLSSDFQPTGTLSRILLSVEFSEVVYQFLLLWVLRDCTAYPRLPRLPLLPQGGAPNLWFHSQVPNSLRCW